MVFQNKGGLPFMETESLKEKLNDLVNIRNKKFLFSIENGNYKWISNFSQEHQFLFKGCISDKRFLLRNVGPVLLRKQV